MNCGMNLSPQAVLVDVTQFVGLSSSISVKMDLHIAAYRVEDLFAMDGLLGRSTSRYIPWS